MRKIWGKDDNDDHYDKVLVISLLYQTKIEARLLLKAESYL